MNVALYGYNHKYNLVETQLKYKMIYATAGYDHITLTPYLEMSGAKIRYKSR